MPRLQRLRTCCLPDKDCGSSEAASTVSPSLNRSEPRRVVQTRMGPCTFTLPNGKSRCEACDHLMSRHEDFAAVTASAPTTTTAATSGTIQGPEITPSTQAAFELPTYICPREETVSKLATLVEKNTVVLVRGTPSCGKTILSELLHQHYQRLGQESILLVGWHNYGDPVEYCTQLYNDKYGKALNRFSFFSCEVTFVVDEAQDSYMDEVFWLKILKSQSRVRCGPRFCLFSSYGSPSSGYIPTKIRATPVRFAPQQRVSLIPSRMKFAPDIGMFYTREEYDDAVNRGCAHLDRSFTIHPEASAYLFSISNGHPAAVSGLLEYIYNYYRSEIKHGRIQTLGKEEVLRALDDELSVLKALSYSAISRSFPQRRLLTSGAAEALKLTLKSHNIPFDPDNDGIQLCFKLGWLHIESFDMEGSELVCVFPTRIHEKYTEVYLSSDYSRQFPIDRFPTIYDLCRETLKNFSKSSLKEGAVGRVGPSSKLTNPEAQFQDEFYRALLDLVGPGVGVSSEWSREGKGRIDFRLIQPKWGVELLRDGDRLAEHCQRFLPTGTYGPWIQKGLLEDWIIIDCRHSQPRKTEQPEPKLWRVVFSDDYTSAEVLDWNNEVVLPAFPLTA